MEHEPDHHGYVEHCVEALRRAGARVTKPRLAVLTCLAASHQAQTPRDLAAALGADVDQATVYRILEAFCDLGLVHRVGPDGGFVACGHLGCSELHVVTRCSRCERTEEVELPTELMASVRRHVETLGFAPGDHFFQMNGTCSQCTDRGRGR